MLTDATYSTQNTQMNLVVYSQFSIATVIGTVHHLIKQYEDDNNGYRAWNAYCERYDWDSVIIKKQTILFPSGKATVFYWCPIQTST